MSDPAGFLTLPRRAYALRHMCATERHRYAMHGIYRDAEAFYATDGTMLGRLREPGGPSEPVWTARPTKALGKRVGEAQVPCGPVPVVFPPVLDALPKAEHKHALLGGCSLSALRAAVDGASGWGGDGPRVATFAIEETGLVVTRRHPDGAHCGELRLTVPDVLQEPARDLAPFSCDLNRIDRLLRCAEEAAPSPACFLRWPTRKNGTGAALVLDVGETLTLLVMPVVVA